MKLYSRKGFSYNQTQKLISQKSTFITPKKKIDITEKKESEIASEQQSDILEIGFDHTENEL